MRLWDKLFRPSRRYKNGFEEWADYYQPVNSGRRPNAFSGDRPVRNSGMMRIAAVVLILAVLLLIRNYPHPLGEQAREGLRQMLTVEWDWQPVLDKSVQLAAQLTNWDNPIIHGPGMGVTDVEPVMGSGLDKQEISLPVSGTVVGVFGWRESDVDGMERYYSGIDISADQGAVVTAALSGEVIKVGTDPIWGTYVLISHGKQSYTLYGCLEDLAVEEGQQVESGQEIARVSENIEVNGSGLHFELREDGKLIDPLERLTLEVR